MERKEMRKTVNDFTEFMRRNGYSTIIQLYNSETEDNAFSVNYPEGKQGKKNYYKLVQLIYLSIKDDKNHLKKMEK